MDKGQRMEVVIRYTGEWICDHGATVVAADLAGGHGVGVLHFTLPSKDCLDHLAVALLLLGNIQQLMGDAKWATTERDCLRFFKTIGLVEPLVQSAITKPSQGGRFACLETTVSNLRSMIAFTDLFAPQKQEINPSHHDEKIAALISGKQVVQLLYSLVTSIAPTLVETHQAILDDTIIEALQNLMEAKDEVTWAHNALETWEHSRRWGPGNAVEQCNCI